MAAFLLTLSALKALKEMQPISMWSLLIYEVEMFNTKHSDFIGILILDQCGAT